MTRHALVECVTGLKSVCVEGYVQPRRYFLGNQMKKVPQEGRVHRRDRAEKLPVAA